MVKALRKTPPAPVGVPDTHPPTEVAAMLREIGIALVEVAQPTPIVEARLLQIAARYTTEPVRVVALPTVLMIQIGDDGYQIEGSTHSSLQLDMAGRIDDIASLAAAGAISSRVARAASMAATGVRAVRRPSRRNCSFTPGRRWTSPLSGARYPVQWRVQTPAGSFGVRAMLDDQELDSRDSTGAIYWEGLCELLDGAGRVVGRGYLEMTGMAKPLRL